MIADLEDMDIAHPRSLSPNGWSWSLTRAEEPTIDSYGYIEDNSNAFNDQTNYPLQSVAVHFTSLSESLTIVEGDYVTITFDAGNVLNIYPPALSGNFDTYYYVGQDGSTYSDRWLCERAKAAATASPTMTPTPSATTTPSPSVTPTASATPSQTPTPSASPSSTPKPTLSPTPSATPSITPSASLPPTPSPSPTPKTACRCYVIAQNGPAGNYRNMLAIVDSEDFNPATNENPLDGYTETSGIESIVFNPADGYLYGVDFNILGTFDLSTGIFLPYPNPIGWIDGPIGWIEVVDVDGLSLSSEPGYLLASVRLKDQPDLLVKLDTITGTAVPGAFSGYDYLVVQPLPSGADDIDDISLRPSDEILYAIISKHDHDDIIATIDLSNGVPTILGYIYCPELGINIQDMEGLNFGCDDQLWGTTGNNYIQETNNRLWEMSWNDISRKIEAFNGRELSYGSDYEGLSCGSFPAPAPSPLPAIIAGGDYDGDGTAEAAIFRSSTGLWKFRNLGDLYFGQMGDQPVPGNYTGDGHDLPGFFRESNGLWKIYSLTRFYFGQNGDTPIPADYDGDGTLDAAYFRDSKTNWVYRGITRFWFGKSGDIPIPADYDGDGLVDPAIYRQPEHLWIVRNITRFYLGLDGDIPITLRESGVPAKPGIFRPSAGLWIIRGITRVYFGQEGDLPIPGNFTGSGDDILSIYRRYQSKWKLRGLSQFYFGRPGDQPVTR